MLFNSIEFALFLPAVFFLYWHCLHRSLRGQNWLLLVASYVFYGWWDPRFLSLIAFSSFLDYRVGLALDGTTDEKRRKGWLLVSLLCNLGMLGIFKYYGFFASNLAAACSGLGIELSLPVLQVVLPVGISFYTFQTLSYTIDVYRRKLPACGDALAFFAFVSFFPQLVAGPIERATHLLGQFRRPRNFEPEKARDGLRQMLWGFFKKLVIADRCAPVVNTIFADHGTMGVAAHWIGILFFAFQIYCDFSGYSDIAIGVSRLFGFDLMRNFACPYFSRDIAEFWRRWHISLSTWFRDYVYIPLGGSRGGRNMIIRNTMIIFTLSGLWHGANWTFLAWGALNALYFLPLILRKANRRNLDTVAETQFFPSFTELRQMATTFLLTLVAWVFFRAQNLGDAFSYLGRLFVSGEEQTWTMQSSERLTLGLIVLMTSVEWIMRKRQHGLDVGSFAWPTIYRWSLYTGVLAILLLLGGAQQQFIYFQF